MATGSTLPTLTRDQLRKVFPSEAMIRAYEALQNAIRLTPDQLAEVSALANSAQTTADAAQTTASLALGSAGAAQSTATSAQGSANLAQATADNALSLSSAIGAAPFITISSAMDLANERSLGVDTLRLTLSDGGPNAAVTLGTTDIYSVLPADVSNSTVTYADATGSFVTLPANATYLIEALLTFQSAATTTGIKLGFSIPTGAEISGLFLHNITANTLEGSYNILTESGKGVTSGVLVANENVPIQGRWLVKTAATAGNAQLQFRSEVATSAVTLKAGLSVLIARRVA